MFPLASLPKNHCIVKFAVVDGNGGFPDRLLVSIAL